MFKKYVSLSVIVSSMTAVLIFQNCGQTPRSLTGGSMPLTSSDANGTLDNNCLQSDNYDACVFFKNPTNTLTAVQSTLTLENLVQQQIFGVQLPKLTNPQFLKDSQLEILKMDGSVVQRSQLRQPASSGDVNLEVLLATQSYFWARSVLDYFSSVQETLLDGFKLSIVAQAPVLGWSANIKTIFLVEDTLNLRKNSALDATTVTHLTTESVLHFLSGAKIYDLSTDTHHQDCGTNAGPLLKNDCCKSKNGCSKAISAGISDYITAVLFSSSPAVGDYLSADAEGAKTCSLARNAGLHKGLTFQQAYDSCASSGRAGQFYDMGVALSATLQSINAQMNDPEKKEFLRTLIISIQQLSGSDDFLRFRDLLLAEAAKSSMSSKISSVIAAEFNKRF